MDANKDRYFKRVLDFLFNIGLILYFEGCPNKQLIQKMYRVISKRHRHF